MSDLETVYAIQNFEAENDDELTFHIGEPITVIQKDDGFNDGWWKGRNMRGQVGIFPMNYITSDEYSCQLVELPTPSNSDLSKPSQINTSMYSSSSYSVNASIVSNNSPVSSNDIRKSVINTLLLPHLRSTLPKDWDIHQVETWLHALHFGSIAENFKAHEITGDVLLELDMESLKELDIITFGKRFKIYNAIMALREECGLQTINMNRMSINTSTFSEEIPRSPTTPPTSARYPKSSSSYYSNFEKPQRVKSFHGSIRDTYDEDQILSPISMYNAKSPLESSPITPSSHYDIMEVNKHNYEHRQFDSKLANSASKRDMNFLQQQQKHQISLPIAQQQQIPEDNANAAPDMEGWLYKQASKYKKWNKRWFVLKGPNLFYFKSPKDIRMKGIINLRGYRIIADESIQAGKYSFKAQHEEERTFYFYTDVDTSMRAWLSSLMKATISRDFASPVLSSSMIPTVSLDVARRMRPRPPSVLYKKEETPNLGLQTPISEETNHIEEDHLNQDSGFDSNEHEEDEEEEEEDHFVEADEGLGEEEEEEGHYEPAIWTAADYIEWVNAVTGPGKITKLQDLKRGDILIEILEELSGKCVTPVPSSTAGSMSMLMLDNIVAAFKFMADEGVVIDDNVTIKDIYGGNEEKIKLMLEAISDWSVGST